MGNDSPRAMFQPRVFSLKISPQKESLSMRNFISLSAASLDDSRGIQGVVSALKCAADPLV